MIKFKCKERINTSLGKRERDGGEVEEAKEIKGLSKQKACVKALWQESTQQHL